MAYGTSQRRVCQALLFQRSSCRYHSVADEQAALRIRLRDLASSRVSYGYRRLHVLLQREGWKVNHKRVYRLYREEGLQMRPKKPRRHVTACRRMERVDATGPNDGWSMDFMSDELFDGRRIRLLTIVDNFTRESLAIEVDDHIGGHRVVEVLMQLGEGAWAARDHKGGQWAGVHLETAGPVGLSQRRATGLQPAGETHRQRPYRSLQWTLAPGVLKRKLVSVPGRRPGEGRDLETGV